MGERHWCSAGLSIPTGPRSLLIKAMKNGGGGISYGSYAEVSFHPTSNDDPAWASLVVAKYVFGIVSQRCH